MAHSTDLLEGDEFKKISQWIDLVTPRIGVRKLDPSAQLPVQGTPGAAGWDVQACLPEKRLLRSGTRVVVPTGLALDIPPGYEVQVRSRSGLSAKHGVVVLNAPGTIDRDYQGEVKVVLINLGEEDFWVEPGMRIAQLVPAEVALARFEEADQQPEATARGEGGFGSTGV
jgi:dUTP pyrophosphatase